MSTTPLTDAINALTTYANETTGASDTTLSEAVTTLVSGYGGGSGTSIGVTDTSIGNILNMFYALENGTAVTGEFTLSSALPNTSTLVFSTGLSTVNGLFVADESQSTLNTGTTPENTLFSLIFNPTSDGSGDYTITRLTTKMSYNGAGTANTFLNRCSWTLTDGDLYVTASYNSSANYTPFYPGHTYRWVAW